MKGTGPPMTVSADASGTDMKVFFGADRAARVRLRMPSRQSVTGVFCSGAACCAESSPAPVPAAV